jgi:DNA polymerase-3 subunit gamma/tau
MGQALYRKYRPTKFSETVGQDTIIKTLADAIASGRISHAYLFAGPRGVGKTTVARILAHEVNNLFYQPDKNHLDIIEIDAASNRRIDEIRDLREKVHIAPSAAKYKVYIVDEVHMLTKEAFNALLKTLEEPPAHCIFILATTEPHKLPETIISRTQRFNFKPIAKAPTIAYLKKIAKAEKIDIEDEAIELLADFGEGSLRDVVSILDQLASSDAKITAGDVRDLLGIPPSQAISQLVRHIANADPKAAISILDELKEQSLNPIAIAKYLSRTLRDKLLNNNLKGSWIINLLNELTDVSASLNPYESLELAIMSAASRQSELLPNAPKSQPKKSPKNDKLNPSAKKNITNSNKKSDKESINNSTASFDLSQWGDLLEKVKQKAPSLYTALRLAEPSISGNRLNLVFPFALHKKKVAEAKHIKTVATLIEELSGASLKIVCDVDRKIASKPVEKTDFDLKTISNIFGSAEVLES